MSACWVHKLFARIAQAAQGAGRQFHGFSSSCVCVLDFSFNSLSPDSPEVSQNWAERS
jgi:hypothetical protein